MIKDDDLKSVKKAISDFEPILGTFERELLIPNIIDRLNYIKERLQQLILLCDDPRTQLHISASLEEILHPLDKRDSSKGNVVGKAYLQEIKRQILETYIAPIDIILNGYEGDDLKLSPTIKLLNKCNMVFQSFSSLEDKLFFYSLRSNLIIIEQGSGKKVVEEPKAYSIILSPFQTTVQELSDVAKSSMDSIKLWSDGIKKQKPQHLTVIQETIRYNSSKEDNKRSLIFFGIQIATIIFTVILIILSQKMNLWLENQELRNSVSFIKLEKDTYKAQVNVKNELLDDLKLKIGSELKSIENKNDKTYKILKELEGMY